MMKSIKDLKEEALQEHYFFVGGKTIFFKELDYSIQENKDFLDYYCLTRDLMRNDHPVYSFKDYLKDNNIPHEPVKEEIRLYGMLRHEYIRTLEKKL